jgi:hypothetical protein
MLEPRRRLSVSLGLRSTGVEVRIARWPSSIVMLGVALRKFYPSILRRVQSYVFLAIFDKIVGRMTMIIIDLSWSLLQKMFLSALVHGKPLLPRLLRKHQ